MWLLSTSLLSKDFGWYSCCHRLNGEPSYQLPVPCPLAMGGGYEPCEYTTKKPRFGG